ncbi:hypothetical protein Tco_0844721 [Tanacetum coccineum]
MAENGGKWRKMDVEVCDKQEAKGDVCLFRGLGMVRLFALAMAVVNRSSSKRASVIRALKKVSPKVVGFDLNSSQSCRSVKRASVARANEKASPKVVGFDLKSAHSENGGKWRKMDVEVCDKQEAKGDVCT